MKPEAEIIQFADIEPRAVNKDLEYDSDTPKVRYLDKHPGYRSPELLRDNVGYLLDGALGSVEQSKTDKYVGTPLGNLIILRGRMRGALNPSIVHDHVLSLDTIVDQMHREDPARFEPVIKVLIEVRIEFEIYLSKFRSAANTN